MGTYKDLVERLSKETYWSGSSGPGSRDIHPAICDEAADAIAELMARAESAERQRDEAMADLEATRAALAEAHGLVGVTPKTMFGVPLARLHQLAEADKAGSILGALDMAKVACALHELNKYKELGGLDYLRQLVEAERDGRCVVSPFKPGDQVWVVERDEIGVADCVSGYVFIAFSGGCAIVHPYIGGCGELDGILHNCLECTREDGGCDVEVFPIDDCHKSCEAAEQSMEVENMG